MSTPAQATVLANRGNAAALFKISSQAAEHHHADQGSQPLEGGCQLFPQQFGTGFQQALPVPGSPLPSSTPIWESNSWVSLSKEP